MARELSTQDAFIFDGENGAKYAVALCGLKNDDNGNRRYEAIVIDVGNLILNKASGAFRYRFTGHSMSPMDEAEYAVNQIHLKKH